MGRGRADGARTTLVALALLWSGSCPSAATEAYARREGTRCSACHLDEYGKGGLNRYGVRYREWGGVFPDEGSAYWIHGAESPHLDTTQTHTLYRKYLKQGKRLFHFDRLGRQRVSCACCHSLEPAGTAVGKVLPLGDVEERYPKYRHEARAFVNLEQAVNLCMVHRMDALPLALGSPPSVALSLYLKSR